jgi:hypothetical protein
MAGHADGGGSGIARLFRIAWARWTVIARAIGNFQARVLLTLFYFVVVPPFALLLKATKDPLQLRPYGTSFWTARGEGQTDTGRRQY